MAGERINVVVTCTARKTRAVPRDLRLGTVPGDSVQERFTSWAARIESNGRASIPAVDLYCGGAWSIIRNLYKDPKVGSAIRIWIISAGQGLLTPEVSIVPYAATFSCGHADSIVKKGVLVGQACEWWRLLTAWRRENGCRVASIADVARNFPHEPLVLAVSKEYLLATYPDVVAARGSLSQKNRMIVICSGAKKSGELEGNFLPCDARFENLFKCCRTDLNSRLLASIVMNYAPKEITSEGLQRSYARQLSRLPEAAHPKRERSGDEAVRIFIVGQLEQDPQAGHTKLLRTYRSSGFACEQSRFRRLFRSVRIRRSG